MESNMDYTILAEIVYSDGSRSTSVDGVCRDKETAKKVCERRQVDYDESRKTNIQLPKITWSYRKIKR